MAFSFQPIDDETCRHVREQRTDPIYGYDYDVMESTAGPGGYGPCRACLQTFTPGEARLLFLFNPFGNELGDFAGPVFIHCDDCPTFAGGPDLPDAITALPLFARSYDRNGHLVEHLDSLTDVSRQVGALFDNPSVAQVHVRNREARCFVAKAVRQPA